MGNQPIDVKHTGLDHLQGPPMVGRAAGIRGGQGNIVSEEKVINRKRDGQPLIGGGEEEDRSSPFHRGQGLNLGFSAPVQTMTRSAR